MIQRILWFDRKFSFDIEEWMFPSIVERIRGTPARVEDRISGLPAETLIKREGNRWSIQENIGHLLDLEPLWLGRLDDMKAGRKTLRPADLENRKTHEADHNSAAVESILESFRASRLQIVGQMGDADESFVLKSALHPRLQKPMRTIDLAFFIAEHDDHHLARITELINRFAKK